MKKNIVIIALMLGCAQGVWATDNTITITSVEQMNELASNVNNGTTYSGTTFLLAGNLDFTGKTFTPIGNSDRNCFSGTFDGQGHTISGITLKADGRQALFGTVKGEGSTVKNLTLDNSTIESTSNSTAAGIVARIPNGGTINGGTIENCHVTSTVTITSKGYAGGIVGVTEAGSVSIKGCTSAASVSTSGDKFAAGGIVGICGYEGTKYSTIVTIDDCLFHGTSVSGTGSENHLGGIIGSCYENKNYNYSKIILSNNFYTYPDASVKGIGFKTYVNGESITHTSSFDEGGDSHGAVCARVVTSEADISDMGTQKNGATYTVGTVVTVYENGITYDGTYYSHVLALPDGEDNTALISKHDGQTFDVKLRGRILYKNGYWNTLSLPFDFSFSSGTIFGDATEYEVRELDLRRYQIEGKTGEGYQDYYTGVQDGKLYLFFTRVTSSISAGKPYIVKWTKATDYNENDPATYDYLSPTFRDVTINDDAPVVVKSSDEKVSFQSTYAPVSYDRAAPSTLYLGAHNALYYPNGAGTVTIGPFRAYFLLDGVQMADSGSSSGGDDEIFVPGGGSARVITINVIDSQATGINEWPTPDPAMEGQQGKDASKWHTLDGRLLTGQPTHSGLYIVNGKTVVVKQ